MAALWQDIRYSLRMLTRERGFTAVAVLTLALGIGASTAIFSGVNALWFNPVPAAEPDRLLEIGAFNKETNRYSNRVSPMIVQELRARGEYFADLTRIQFSNQSWFNEDEGWLEPVLAVHVSSSFFSLCDASPHLGRTFAPDEGRAAASPVIVVSHEFWKNKLGGDPRWVGKSLRLLDQYYTVIGVMPPYFRFPLPSPAVWIPADDPGVKPADEDPQGLRFRANNQIVARLAPGVSIEQAQAMLDVLARRHEETHRRKPYGSTLLRARPLREAFVGADVGRTIPGFVGAMIFVLLIACANVANLNLARTEARQHELAIRRALGAGRLQLLRQLLLESLLLALAGAIAGIALTYWSFGLMERLLPHSVPRLRPIEFDWNVLAYSLLTAVTAGLVSGTVPAWFAATRPATSALKLSGVQAMPGLLRNFYRRGLVVLEVSVSMVLLVGAGLMVHSVIRLLRTDMGFDPANLIWVQLSPTHDSKTYRLDEVHRRLSAVPGVEAVGSVAMQIGWGKFVVTGPEEPVELYYEACGVGTADPVKARRVPLLRGRYLDEADVRANTGAVLVNEMLAQRCWPGESAVGKTFRSAADDDHSTFQVVGVVGDVRDVWRVTNPIRPTFYRPQQIGFANTTYVMFVRTRTKPHGLIKPLLAAVKAVGPELRKPSVKVVEDLFYDSTRARRTYMCYLGVFGAVGLLLAGVGVYAILAFSVAVRTREIGIRMALGAAGSGVVWMVLRQGMTLVGIGIGLGLGAAWALTRLLRGMLYEVSPMDPLALVAGALLLSLIALLASSLPARRAARIDPMRALRYE